MTLTYAKPCSDRLIFWQVNLIPRNFICIMAHGRVRNSCVLLVVYGLIRLQVSGRPERSHNFVIKLLLKA